MSNSLSTVPLVVDDPNVVVVTVVELFGRRVDPIEANASTVIKQKLRYVHFSLKATASAFQLNYCM